MFSKFLLSQIFLLISLNVFAQHQNVYYLKNDQSRVSTKDSADFIRVIKEPDSGSTAYSLFEYYTNGKLKRQSKTLTLDKITLDGECINYYKSGKKYSVSKYSNGYFVGDIYTYFPNGKLYKIEKSSQQSYTFYVKASYDTSGKEMVANGNGHYIIYGPGFKKIFSEGEIHNGIKNGKWKMNNVTQDSLTVTEIYNNGKLVSGKSIDKAGKQYSFGAQDDEIWPSYPGGSQAFSDFLKKHIQYPPEARKNKIEGYVMVSFFVEVDGSLTDIKIVPIFNTPTDNDLAQEAIRVVKLSPKWHPRMQFGRAVRTEKFTPVNFSLNH